MGYVVSSDYETIKDKESIIYRCGRCGHTFEASDLELMPSIKCPYCGYRVIYKVRRQGRKVIKAV